jgi:hypothetical protein
MGITRYDQSHIKRAEHPHVLHVYRSTTAKHGFNEFFLQLTSAANSQHIHIHDTGICFFGVQPETTTSTTATEYIYALDVCPATRVNG